jgi:RNA polymerase sigma-70 factor (ECF subfamily)
MDSSEKIVRRYGPMVWRTVWRFAAGREADAADCFQEVFVSALEVVRRTQVQNWEALLRHLATRKGLDLLRRRSGERQRLTRDVEWEELSGGRAAPDERMERQELMDRLQVALARLPEAMAEAFCLRHVEEMSYGQIGEVTGATVGSVRVLVHRAKERVRELMTAYESSGEVRHE